MVKKTICLHIIIGTLVGGCNFGPKTTEPYIINRVVDKSAMNSEVDYNLHEAVIKEILPTSKYYYAKLVEGDNSYWIATQKQELKIGTSYLYNESLLKTAFESKELGRVFDTIYLVTSLIPKDHGMVEGTFHGSLKNKDGNVVKKEMIIRQDTAASFMGIVRISDLVNNPSKYENSEVIIRGECFKVNANILDKNWLHFKDGSMDDYDLVITSQEQVQKGSTISIRAVVHLNVDLGSGYSYPILLENGRLVE
jgi:hypothetical protein